MRGISSISSRCVQNHERSAWDTPLFYYISQLWIIFRINLSMFVRLSAHLFVRFFLRLFVHLFLPFFLRLFAHLYVRFFLRLSVHLFVLSFFVSLSIYFPTFFSIPLSIHKRKTTLKLMQYPRPPPEQILNGLNETLSAYVSRMSNHHHKKVLHLMIWLRAH